MARRRSSRHSRRRYMVPMSGMSAFSFDSAQVSWGAVGAGFIVGAFLTNWYMKKRSTPSSSPVQGLGARYQPPSPAEVRKKLCKENPRYAFC